MNEIIYKTEIKELQNDIQKLRDCFAIMLFLIGVIGIIIFTILFNGVLA